MSTVKKVSARQILDSRGNPTLETTVVLSDDRKVCASVPSGASVGSFEALELRDQDPNLYDGKGVLKAVETVNTTISQALVGKEVHSPAQTDKLLIELDGTENKSKLGANTILSVSIAMLKAGAVSENVPVFKFISSLSQVTDFKMPKILANLINGGMHAGWNLDFQEFIVVAYRAASVKESLAQIHVIYNNLRKLLIEKGVLPLVGDEGGFAPKFARNADAFFLLEKVCSGAKLSIGNDVFFGLDAAATNFYKDEIYKLQDLGGASSDDLLEYYKTLFEKYPTIYIEDPFAETDFKAWEKANSTLPENILLTGDDLTVTNPQKFNAVLEKKLIRGVIIKPNQIGTISEALEVCRIAKKAGIGVVVSHRSGETNDDFISDFAIGVGADFVKFGAPARGERVAKYNRLLEIEEYLA